MGRINHPWVFGSENADSKTGLVPIKGGAKIKGDDKSGNTVMMTKKN
jgi:hypothetical protein